MKTMLLALSVIVSAQLSAVELPNIAAVNRNTQHYIGRREYYEDNRDERTTWRAYVYRENDLLLWELSIKVTNIRTKKGGKEQWALVSDGEIGHFVAMLGKFGEWCKKAEQDRALPFEKNFPAIDQREWQIVWNGREGVLRNKEKTIQIKSDDAVFFSALLIDSDSMRVELGKHEQRKKMAEEYAAKLK